MNTQEKQKSTQVALVFATKIVLLLVGVLSLLLSFLFGLNPMLLMFLVDFEVENRSGETIFFTPVGASECGGKTIVLPQYSWSLPAIPAAKCGGHRLDPGEYVQITYDWDDVLFSDIVVCNENNTCRQVVVIPNAAEEKCCFAPNEKLYRIGPLEGYKIAGPELLAAVEEGRINPRARRIQLIFFFPFLVLFTWLAVRRIAKKHFTGTESGTEKQQN